MKSRTRRNIRKRQSLLTTKIKDIVTDLHWKSADFLCKNFETIVLPKFEVKQMNRKTTRRMLILSHYKFKEKLRYKCKQYNRNLIEVNESYTSKTCGQCGKIKVNLGGNKVYKCKGCKLECDRDYNGARNILLRLYSKLNA